MRLYLVLMIRRRITSSSSCCGGCSDAQHTKKTSQTQSLCVADCQSLLKAKYYSRVAPVASLIVRRWWSDVIFRYIQLLVVNGNLSIQVGSTVSTALPAGVISRATFYCYSHHSNGGLSVVLLKKFASIWFRPRTTHVARGGRGHVQNKISENIFLQMLRNISVCWARVY